MDKNLKEAILQTYFYPLSNHHTVIICGIALIKRTIEECLADDCGDKDVKMRLFETLCLLDQIEDRGFKAADSAVNLRKYVQQFLSLYQQRKNDPEEVCDGQQN